MDIDLIADSEGHRAILRSLMDLEDRTGKPSSAMEVAEVTPFQHPVDGTMRAAPIMPGLDGDAPEWFVRMLGQLRRAGLVEEALLPNGRSSWLPTPLGRNQVARFDMMQRE